MSLKSFDKFCEKVINGESVQQKEIFDERQSIVRSKITIRALWAFIAVAGINLIIMECGPQWCESWVLSTALFGAFAYLYWVIANARQGTLFGVNGTSPVALQAGYLIGFAAVVPLMFILDSEDHADFFTNFFIRNGMVSEYLVSVLSCFLLLIAGIVMAVNIRKYKRDSDREDFHK